MHRSHAIHAVSAFFLNGVFAYGVFALYSVSLSPFISGFIEFGEKNAFVGWMGLLVLLAEYFAFKYKLKMIRVRTEVQRILFKHQTGIDVTPRPGSFVFFGFFMRMALRLMVLFVSLTALGFKLEGKDISGTGIALLFICFFIDMGGLIHTYMHTGFYRDPVNNEKQAAEEIKALYEWNRQNFPKAMKPSAAALETLADVVLHVFAVMLFTTLWATINGTGIAMLHERVSHQEDANAAARYVLPMMLAWALTTIMPMRIAYWIEDSMMAIERRQKFGLGAAFLLVVVYACAPVIIEFLALYYFESPGIIQYIRSEPFNRALIAALIFLTLMLHLYAYGFRQAGAWRAGAISRKHATPTDRTT